MVALTRWLVLGITCVASAARGDAPVIEGRVSVGLRGGSTADTSSEVFDDSTNHRLALEGSLGRRFGRVVVGGHVGLATPLRFDSVLFHDSGELVPTTTFSITPLDLGLGAEADLGRGVWASAWLGVTVAFLRASSPATHVDAVDFTGDIPAASWRDRTTSLGAGAALGVDLLRTRQGRLGAMIAIASEGIGPFAFRADDGSALGDVRTHRARSLTLGLSYAY